MKVSICSAVLNQSEWLKEMIQSVLNQTFKEWELIVIDDGSTEDIKAVVDSFNDQRLIYEKFPENRGIPHGVNRAFELARGEYFQPLAADETIEKNKLQKQVEYLDSHPEVDCVWGLPHNGPLGERPLWEQNILRAHNRSKEAWIKTLLNLENVPLGGCSLLMRRSVLDSIGYMDTNLTAFSDHEWYVRFFEKHVGVMLPYRCAAFKANPNAVSAGTSDNRDKFTKELTYVREKHPLMIPPVGQKVTIGIPVRNMEAYVGDAIRSAINQTHQDLEVLVLDDCSTDKTVDAVKEFTDSRIKIMSFSENKGQMDAQNEMAAKAEGDFFVALSADDVLDPTYVERCLAEFSKNPWLEFCSTQTSFITETGADFTGEHPFLTIEKASNKTREDWLKRLYLGNVYFGAGMTRTKVLRDVGGWDKSLGVISDYELYLKLLSRDNIHVIEEPLTRTRIHGKNQSLLNQEAAQALPGLYKKAKAPYYPPQMKVVIATPFYEVKGYSPYITSITYLAKLLTMTGINWEFMEHAGDSYVHRARNTICAKFLDDPDATDLLFIDSDMGWNPDAVVKMLFLPDEVVGGTYPTKNKWDDWTSHPMVVTEGDKSHYIGRVLADGTPLIQAHVLAGGFLRIKRSLLEQYKDFYPHLRYFEPAADPGNKDREYTEFFACGVDRDKQLKLFNDVEQLLSEGEDVEAKVRDLYKKFNEDKPSKLFYGEDHFFSKRLREMGIKMFIYPNATIHHCGVKIWSGNFDEHLKALKAQQDAAA